jgi:sugar/nucleoside kinase (ribokinase family)
MAWRQRKELPSIQYDHQSTASLRIVASGTIFTTHTLNVRSFPSEGSTARAQSVSRRRGGAAANSLAVISQFSGTKTWLVAPIGGGTDGAGLVRELEEAGVSTKFCVRREGEGIPTAFIIKSSPSIFSLFCLWGADMQSRRSRSRRHQEYRFAV